MIGYGQWDLNNPAGYGGKQSEFALGFLYGHLIGNFMNLQFKLTRDVQEKNLGGKDTRIWVQLVIPLWTQDLDHIKQVVAAHSGGHLIDEETAIEMGLMGGTRDAVAAPATVSPKPTKGGRE